MINIIQKPRGQGKTRDCILESNRTGFPILCINRQEAERVHRQASEDGIYIPWACDYSLVETQRSGIPANVPAYIIDNLDLILAEIFRRPIHLASLEGTAGDMLRNSIKNVRDYVARPRWRPDAQDFTF
jgi:hypothetical protein